MQFDIDHDMCTVSLTPTDEADATSYVEALRAVPSTDRTFTKATYLADMIDRFIVRGDRANYELASVDEETALATALEKAAHPDFNRFCDALEAAQSGGEE